MYGFVTPSHFLPLLHMFLHFRVHLCLQITLFLFHLKSTLEGKREEVPEPMISLLPQKAPRLLRDFGKTFQKRRVSSPAPVTIEDPSGLMAK